MVMLSSQCIDNGETILSLTCRVQNVSHLFWFFNGNTTEHYGYVRESEDQECPCNLTGSMLPGVSVTVLEASGGDSFSAVSRLRIRASPSALLANNINIVACGSANTRRQCKFQHVLLSRLEVIIDTYGCTFTPTNRV